MTAQETTPMDSLDPRADLVRRGRRLLTMPFRSGSGPGGDPSLDEIQAMASAIQAEWTLRERQCRSPQERTQPVEARPVRFGQ